MFANPFAQASRVHVTFFFNLIFTVLNVRSQQFLCLAWSSMPPYAFVNVASMGWTVLFLCWFENVPLNSLLSYVHH